MVHEICERILFGNGYGQDGCQYDTVDPAVYPCGEKHYLRIPVLYGFECRSGVLVKLLAVKLVVQVQLAVYRLRRYEQYIEQHRGSENEAGGQGQKPAVPGRVPVIHTVELSCEPFHEEFHDPDTASEL